MAAMTSLFSKPPTFDLNVLPLQPTDTDIIEEWLRIPADLPYFTDLDLTFSSELPQIDNQLINYIDSALEIAPPPNLPIPDNLGFGRLLQENNDHLNPPSSVAKAENNETCPEPHPPYQSATSLSIPLESIASCSQITEPEQEATKDENMDKDNLTSRAGSPVLSMLKDEKEKYVDDKVDALSEVETNGKQSEESPDHVRQKGTGVNKDVKNQKELSKLQVDLSSGVRKTVVLWKFIRELLDSNDSCVSWISREDRTFRFVDSKQAAKLWGQRKNKRNMTYEKMSRALRYYYDRQIMYHIDGQKLMYKFGDGATEGEEASVTDIDGKEKVAAAS
ncbi:ETS-related transcription factor Elf-4-like isoform X5 [Montipora capricornis]